MDAYPHLTFSEAVCRFRDPPHLPILSIYLDPANPPDTRGFTLIRDMPILYGIFSLSPIAPPPIHHVQLSLWRPLDNCTLARTSNSMFMQ